MFGKTDKTRREITTLLGAQTRIKGDVEFGGGLHVDGTIVGNVTGASDDAAISISEGGVVEGSVRAPEVVLNGTVKGDVTATRRVELGPTAKVVGNVIYQLIEMAIGAEVNGKLMHEDGASGTGSGREGTVPASDEPPAAGSADEPAR
jgi:cytoskeletal protein CcmA (bactofilin family)